MTPIPPDAATVYDMTRMALAETAPPRVLAAYDALPPNRAGDPVIGLLGFMSPGDCLTLVKAADLAHRAAGTDGWVPETVEYRARSIARRGAWRTNHSHALPAIRAYKAAIQQEAAS